MCRWIVVSELGDLALLGVHQPADTLLWCMVINKWAVLVRHVDRMDAQSVDSASSWVVGTKPEMVKAVLYQLLYPISFHDPPKFSAGMPI